jgi:circadian clock protein KaiC
VAELRSRLQRVLSILKERASEYDASVREFIIRRDGIHILDPLPEAEALLTGVAHQAGLPAESPKPSPSTGGTRDDDNSHR